jgi:hypothetical protein
VTILRSSSIWSQPQDWRTGLVVARGWGQDMDDPGDAQVANAYGQWADRLFLCIAFLFLPGAVGDFVLWVTSRSLMTLLGPATLLVLCVAYLELRRRFRRSGPATEVPDRHRSQRSGEQTGTWHG